jgi:hypothetical protein
VSQAILEVSGGLRLRGQVAVAARDGSPITSLLESNANVAAKLALGLVPTSDLVGSGDVVVGPSVFEARAVQARSPGFDMNLEYAQMGPGRSVAIYLVVGPVASGIDVSGDGTKVVLSEPAQWFATRVVAMRAAEQRYRE